MINASKYLIKGSQFNLQMSLKKDNKSQFWDLENDQIQLKDTTMFVHANVSLKHPQDFHKIDPWNVDYAGNF